MKKTFISIFTFIFLFTSTFPVNAASSVTRTVETLSLENGYHIIITTEVFENDNVARAISSSKTASRTYELKNRSDSTVATFKLTGKFSYDGSTSSCTSASHSTSIFDDNWKFTSATSTCSGNKAVGNFTAKLTILGITWQTISEEITLTCDKNGNIY